MLEALLRGAKALALILDPSRLDPRITGKPAEFVIIQETRSQNGHHLQFICRAQHENGKVSEYRFGQLAILRLLSDQEAESGTPSQVFARLAAEIVQNDKMLQMSREQRGFLLDMATAGRDR